MNPRWGFLPPHAYWRTGYFTSLNKEVPHLERSGGLLVLFNLPLVYAAQITGMGKRI